MQQSTLVKPSVHRRDLESGNIENAFAIFIALHKQANFVTSAGSAPSLGKHVLMSYLPPEYAREGTKLVVEYLGEHYPVTVEVAGSTPLFDPKNDRIMG